MLDDYRQLIVFVYCCMLMVSHRTQGARLAENNATSKKTGLWKTSKQAFGGRRAKPRGGHRYKSQEKYMKNNVESLAEGDAVGPSGGARDYHDCVRLHYHLLTN